MITIKVELLAYYSQERIREVKIPKDLTTEEMILKAIYHYGQNDIQPQNLPSVRMGDVIHYKGKKIIIKAIGFKEISQEEYDSYKKVPQIERSYQDIVRNFR